MHKIIVFRQTDTNEEEPSEGIWVASHLRRHVVATGSTPEEAAAQLIRWIRGSENALDAKKWISVDDQVVPHPDPFEDTVEVIRGGKKASDQDLYPFTPDWITSKWETAEPLNTSFEVKEGWELRVEA